MSEHTHQRNLERTHLSRQALRLIFVMNITIAWNKTELSLVVYLSPLSFFAGYPTYWEQIPDIISAHKLIRNSGLPIFWGLRILVQSQLNVKAWIFHLNDYWDQQLVDLIGYGFPLDFDRAFQHIRTILGTFISLVFDIRTSSTLIWPCHCDFVFSLFKTERWSMLYHEKIWS